MRRWFDMYSSPQASDGFDALGCGYMTSSPKVGQNRKLRPYMLHRLHIFIIQPPSQPLAAQENTLAVKSTRRAAPAWTLAEDRKADAAKLKRCDGATDETVQGDPHFMDMEGNLQLARARSAVLASRLEAPKRWGHGHTHVAVSTRLYKAYD